MASRLPDFRQLSKVLRREVPDRPTLFEFFLNARLYTQASGAPCTGEWGSVAHWRWVMRGFHHFGYDYVTVNGSRFGFKQGERHRASSVSLNEGALITDRRSFDAYPWARPADFPSVLDELAADLPAGMRLIVHGPGGVLENVIGLTGYDNLCYLLADDPALVQDLFTAVGERLLQYYRLHAGHPAVGACISNDDWGFKTQTMLPTAAMRAYVFPWHEQIVAAIHAAGQPAILHSCGNLAAVFEDVVSGMRYDAKHSYEDGIVPVEDFYRQWGGRIAILGGVDVDFLCRRSPAEVTQRARALLAQSAATGGYALGSGNSIPEYVPDTAFLAMTRAALELT